MSLHHRIVTRKVLVATVGPLWMRDLSVGPILGEMLATIEVPSEISLVVEDFSYNVITAIQRLEEMSVDCVIFVGAEKGGQEGGTLTRRLLTDKIEEPNEELQSRTVQGLTGAINLDNLVVLASYYDVLPYDTVVFAIEPVDDTWGEHLSPKIADRTQIFLNAIMAEATRHQMSKIGGNTSNV